MVRARASSSSELAALRHVACGQLHSASCRAAPQGHPRPGRLTAAASPPPPRLCRRMGDESDL